MKLRLPDPVTASPPEALSPLEEGLRGPGAALLREQTQAQLSQLEQRLRAEISAGVQPQRYRALISLLDACLGAQEVLADTRAVDSSLVATMCPG